MNRELRYRLSKQKRTKSIKESTELFFKKNGLRNQYTEAYIQSEWKNIVGEPVAKQTTSIVVKGNRLILGIASAPLRNELLMSKKKLLANVNESLEEPLIHQVVFV